MLHTVCTALLGCLLSGVPPAAPQDPLAFFAPLVGARWTATGELANLGTFTVERMHEYVLGGRWLRVRQRLAFDDGTTVEEETLIGHDTGAGRLVMRAFASDGSHSEGVEDPGHGPQRIVFEGRTTGGRTSDWRTTMFIIDADAFSVLLELRSGREFVPAATFAFRRSGDGS